MDWWASNHSATATSTLCDGNQHVDTTTASAVFDPWLNCDDLDLGALLEQSQTGDSPSNYQQTAHNQQFSQSTRAQPQPPTHQSKLPPDNKGHIISIINNSASSQPNQQQQQHNMYYQQQQQQQQQQQHQTSDSFDSHHHKGNTQRLMVQQRPNTTGSTAASPLSSSLGSSPPNHHTASLLSPPHSSTSPIFAHHQDQQPTPYFIECFDPNRHQEHKQLYVSNNQNESATTACYGLSSATTPPTANSIIMTYGNTTQHVGPKTISTISRTTSGGSSLLTSSSNDNTNTIRTKAAAYRRSHNKRTAKQMSTCGGSSANGGGSIGDGIRESPDRGGPRPRRCRHITEFALSGEEKRLLVKEGYPDFPTSCQARPLTKAEERILRKIRRKIRNKRSAQCSRQRKKEYVEELELKYAETLAENVELRRLLAATSACNNELEQQQQQHQHQHQHQHQPTSDTFLTVGGSSTSGESSMDQISWGDLMPRQQQQQQQQHQQLEQTVKQESSAIVYS